MAVDSASRARWAVVDANTPQQDEIGDVLESLVAHPGWRLVAQQARHEWDQRERVGRKNALGDTDDKRALDKLRQITAAQEAVEWVLAWPTQEIQRRKRQETASTDGPGSGSDLAAQMSRRGSL